LSAAPGRKPTTYRFNASGVLIQITNALGADDHVRARPRDARARLDDRCPRPADGLHLRRGRQRHGITDPLGHTSTRALDTAGRLTTLTTPLAHGTRYAYDALNRLTGITDPVGGFTPFAYDPNGNLLRKHLGIVCFKCGFFPTGPKPPLPRRCRTDMSH
jgi:YD repeat-containing protein